MKLFNYLFTGIICALTITSCAKNEDFNNSDSELIGNWKVAEIYFEGNNTIETSGIIETYSFYGDGYNMVLQLRFDENSNEFSSYGGYNIQLNTIQDGKNIITEWMNPGFIDSGKWTIDGKNLIVTNSRGETQSAMILSLNQHTLVLSYNFIYETLKFDSSLTYEVKSVFSFEKQVVDQS